MGVGVGVGVGGGGEGESRFCIKQELWILLGVYCLYVMQENWLVMEGCELGRPADCEKTLFSLP